MRNYFVLDGKPSPEFGTWVAKSTMYDGAEHDDETVEIPGRNGALVFSNGRWKNMTATVSCYMPYEMQINLDGLRAYLSSRHSYVRYEEAFKPDEYRMVRYKGPFTVAQSDRVGAAFDLQFDCMPQRFLKSGETPVTLSAFGTVYNPTNYEARPLVRCNGTSGTVTINGVTVSVSGCSAYVDLDCYLMESYEGSTSRNSTTTLTNGEFPTLQPGINAVSFTGFSSVVITPHWWTI